MRGTDESSYVIDGVRLGQNRKRPGSARRYIICPGTADAVSPRFLTIGRTPQRLWRHHQQIYIGTTT